MNGSYLKSQSVIGTPYFSPSTWPWNDWEMNLKIQITIWIIPQPTLTLNPALTTTMVMKVMQEVRSITIQERRFSFKNKRHKVLQSPKPLLLPRTKIHQAKRLVWRDTLMPCTLLLLRNCINRILQAKLRMMSLSLMRDLLCVITMASIYKLNGATKGLH